MAKFIDAVKVISAGCITEISGCRIIQKGDNTQARAAKKQCSTLGRKLTNHRTMQRTLYFLMAANFKPTDFFLTLTFDDTHLPRTRKEVMKAVEKFVKLLRKHRPHGDRNCFIFTASRASMGRDAIMSICLSMQQARTWRRFVPYGEVV